MLTEELVLRFPPAYDNGDGTYTCRTYPLTIYARQGWRQITLQGVDIIPNVGILEAWVSDTSGGLPRRHATQAGSSLIPQASGDELRPLTLTLVNLNPEASIDVVARFVGWPAVPGMPSGDSWARFQGADPFGTSGAAETTATLANTAGDVAVTAQGSSFTAFLVTNAATTTRTIRDITGQVRVLAPTGTGTLPVPEKPASMTIIIKKDGVTLEASTDTLNLLSTMFSLTNTPTGTVNVTGFASGAVTSAAIAAGAIASAAQLGANVVTAGKLADGAVDTTGRIADGIVTFAKLAAAAIGNTASQVAVGNHTHSTGGIVTAWSAKGYTATSVSTSLTTIDSVSLTLTNAIVYDVVALSIQQGNSSSTGYIKSYVRITTTGTNELGMQTGTVGGERPLAAFSAATVTGTGAAITVSSRAQMTAGTGSVNDCLTVAIAIPRSVGVY